MDKTNLFLIVFNVLIMALNVAFICLGAFLWDHKRREHLKFIEKSSEIVKPRLLRDALSLEETCIVCNGNGITPAPIKLNKISLHEICKNKLLSGEVKIKEVGKTLNNEKTNNLEQMEQFLPIEELTKIDWYQNPKKERAKNSIKQIRHKNEPS